MSISFTVLAQVRDCPEPGFSPLPHNALGSLEAARLAAAVADKVDVESGKMEGRGHRKSVSSGQLARSAGPRGAPLAS